MVWALQWKVKHYIPALLSHLLDAELSLRPLPSYLPVLVSTIRALARHLKEDSTAPTATASEGSRVRRVERLSSSNSCRWNVAASASRAIWQRHPVEGGGREVLHTITPSTTQTERNTQTHTWTTMFMLVPYCSKARTVVLKKLFLFGHLNNYNLNKLVWLTLWCSSRVSQKWPTFYFYFNEINVLYVFCIWYF